MFEATDQILIHILYIIKIIYYFNLEYVKSLEFFCSIIIDYKIRYFTTDVCYVLIVCELIMINKNLSVQSPFILFWTLTLRMTITSS